MKHSTKDFHRQCGCREAGCSCNAFLDIPTIKACVDDFAEQMKAKLIKKLSRDFKYGWDDPSWIREDILRQLVEHVGDGDMIDVANFAMFAWNQE